MKERTETWDSFWGKLLRIDFFEGQWEMYRKVADARAAWLVDTYGLDRDRPLLSLACGEGGIELALARLGYAVTGIDRCAEMIHFAREASSKEELTATFLVGDIRKDSPLPTGNGTVCCFDTFGLLSPEAEKAIAQRMASALGPGGIILVDSPVRESITQSRPWFPVKGGHLLLENKWDKESGFQKIGLTFIEPDGSKVYLEDPYDETQDSYRGVLRYIYTDAEMRGLLGSSGLPVTIRPHQRKGYYMAAASSNYGEGGF